MRESNKSLQATRDATLSSASRFTLVGPACLSELKQYSVVRVRQLLRQPEHYDGWRVNQRPPQVRDKGTIVDILQARACPITTWLSVVGRMGFPYGLAISEQRNWNPSTNRPTRSLKPAAVMRSSSTMIDSHNAVVADTSALPAAVAQFSC